MNRQTILYIHHGKGLGGAPISLLTLIKALDPTRYRPVVLFLYDSEALKLFRDEGVEIVGPINLSDFSHTQVYWFRWYHAHLAIKALTQTLITLFIAAPHIIRTIQPKIIHLNTSSLIAWGIAAHHHNIPVVWHIRESLAAGYFGLRRFIIKKIIAHYATIIVPICETDGRFWDKPQKKVLYNPVDINRFTPAAASAALPTNSQYLLFLGGLSHQKGTGLMLEVFERVRYSIPNIKLIIAGAFSKPQLKGLQKFSPEKNYMAAAYQRYETLKEDIILTGPTTQIPELMEAASIVFFPAQVDHFARPVIEAGCMAKPVIASDLPQLREIIQHNVTGYLIPKDDVQAWTTSTINLLLDQEKQIALKSAHYEYCHQRFAQHFYATAIEKIYHAIVSGK